MAAVGTTLLRRRAGSSAFRRKGDPPVASVHARTNSGSGRVPKKPARMASTLDSWRGSRMNWRVSGSVSSPSMGRSPTPAWSGRALTTSQICWWSSRRTRYWSAVRVSGSAWSASSMTSMTGATWRRLSTNRWNREAI